MNAINTSGYCYHAANTQTQDNRLVSNDNSAQKRVENDRSDWGADFEVDIRSTLITPDGETHNIIKTIDNGIIRSAEYVPNITPLSYINTYDPASIKKTSGT